MRIVLMFNQFCMLSGGAGYATAAIYTNHDTETWSRRLGNGAWWRRGTGNPTDQEIFRAKTLDQAKACVHSYQMCVSAHTCTGSSDDRQFHIQQNHVSPHFPADYHHPFLGLHPRERSQCPSSTDRASLPYRHDGCHYSAMERQA